MLIKNNYDLLQSRLQENRNFIQCIVGPRQVGKTTMVVKVLRELNIDYSYNIAQENNSFSWISSIWESARLQIRLKKIDSIIIAIDEIQKVQGWSEVIKMEWDFDTVNNIPIKVVLLGSSRLLIQSGLSESLAGRFELIQMTHWSFMDMQSEFGVTAEQFAWFGGYPGANKLMRNEKRWKDYIYNSLIETTISKDILMLDRINKPALLRQLFFLAASYSGQILSYNKMLGQLQDVGNTTTLKHYLTLLETAGLSKGIQKLYKEELRTKSSIPKLQIYNSALVSGQTQITFKEAIKDTKYWGRIVESCVGAHLINNSLLFDYKVYYWCHVNDEIDFVLKYKGELIGIEVKSSLGRPTKGMNAFKNAFDPKKIYLIDNRVLSWQDFIQINPIDLF